MLRINRLVEKTRAEGPGTRLCIWAQGCHNRCAGCFAKETWDESGGTLVPLAQIKTMLHTLRHALEGVTFLGGEPFEQPAALAELGEYAHELGLSVITFTGKTHEWLLSRKCADIDRLLQTTDVLIDGPFRLDLQDFSRPLVGSANQRFLFLTDRYRPEDILSLSNRFELRMGSDGRVQINGMGDLNKLESYLNTVL